MLVFNFTRAFAATSAHDWVHAVLGHTIGAAGVVTGTDFTFGKGARAISPPSPRWARKSA